MRGVCIFSICLHNLLHLRSEVSECEFLFYNVLVDNLLGQSSYSPWKVFEYFFSFWGWYGVTIFMFLSGYGLVMKYEVKGESLSPLTYIIRNYVKLFLLIIIPLTFMYRGHMFNYLALTHLTFTINLIDPHGIIPGVFWYFGLTIQFYIIYIFFYYKRSKIWVVLLSLLSMALVVFFVWKYSSYLYYSRHNSIGWLMVFLFGVWYARGGHESNMMRMIHKHRLASIGLFGALWIFSSLNALLWVVSPIFFILALIAIIQKGKKQEELPKEGTETSQNLFSRLGHYLGSATTYLGLISAGIFVWHPVFRMYAYHALDKGADIRLVTAIYVVASILTAALFTPLYKKMEKWAFKVLHLK